MLPAEPSANASTDKISMTTNSWDPLILLLILTGFFGGVGYQMGLPNMLGTLLSTAHDLLLNTAFFIMSLMIITGALSHLMVEYGIIQVAQRCFSPFMGFFYNLPGKAALAGLMTFFADNPAIINFAGDKSFAKGFSRLQLLSMVNFGTSFGMGFIVIAFMLSISLENSILSMGTAVCIGMFSAMVGSIISTRLVQWWCRKQLANAEQCNTAQIPDLKKVELSLDNRQAVQHQPVGFLRFTNTMLKGGKEGLQLGLEIIPGILIISTIIFILTMGKPEAGYNGQAYQGVGILNFLGEHFSQLFYVLFGFKSSELVAYPLTTLGATGAALALVPPFIQQGLVGGNEIAVFTAMSMVWSAFLCTHTSMMEVLDFSKFASKAMLAHAVAGVAAGSIAHYLYLFVEHNYY